MATKKAAAKKPAAKKSAAKKPTKKIAAKKVVAKSSAVKAAGSKTAKKLTVKEKALTIKPGALIAEFLGVFILASMAIVFANTGVEFLLVIIAIIVIFAVISGAHLNPAVSFAAWINRKMYWPKLLSFIAAQSLGAVLAFFVMGAFINEQNATYAEDGTRTVATVESKLIEMGYVTEEDIDGKTTAEVVAEVTGGQATVEQVASQIGVKSSFSVPEITAHKELYVFFVELVGSIIVGLGAGFALLTSRRKSLSRGFAYGGAIFIGLAIAGGAAVLNPALAGAIQAFPLSGDFATVIWPYIIFILATTVGVTIGFSLYNVMLKDADACTCGPDCNCGK
ncbi:aquaporin [Candidatus Saccharibacteria bacterium]|nr:aquaporin [Candidatus Saccharibacteria bacterium]